MKNTKLKREWILLVHQLPAKPTNLRVRIWRKLQKYGAVAIKNSVYVLPANEKTREDFQWLKQEIESAGGEAAVFLAGSVEGATDAEIIAAFSKARDDEFAIIAAGFATLNGAVREQTRGKHLSAGRLTRYETELDRLHGELERITVNDFFNARGRKAAQAAYELSLETMRVALGSPARNSRAAVKAGTLDLDKYQGRRWVTRRNLHIDRLACAWLIKQFIDKRPRFDFVDQDQTVQGAIPFDMYGVEFSHQGEDCTFETMLKRFGLGGNRALREIAEIVHDIDLKDDKFNRLEAAGLNAIVAGLSVAAKDDRELLQQASTVFEGLYELLRRKTDKRKPKNVRSKRRRAR